MAKKKAVILGIPHFVLEKAKKRGKIPRLLSSLTNEK